MRKYLFAFALFVFALTLRLDARQTHPCDQAAPAQVTIQAGAPHKVQFCSPASDNVEAIVGYVDGTAFDMVSITAKTAPNAIGKVLYESAAFIQVPKGAHTLTVRAYNRDGLSGNLQLGAESAPLSFAAADSTPPASAPSIMGVVK